MSTVTPFPAPFHIAAPQWPARTPIEFLGHRHGHVLLGWEWGPPLVGWRDEDGRVWVCRYSGGAQPVSEPGPTHWWVLPC